MSNYTLNNIKRFHIHINEDEYWDMHINHDDLGDGIDPNESCLASYIDTDFNECISGDSLISLSGYTYDKACSYGLNLNNIGLTGVDNGQIKYRKDKITNKEFYDIYTKSNYHLDAEDLRLHLHTVSGTTLLYEYPISINENGTIKLNGGFYQGFFRSAKQYSILPSSIDNQWNLEFVIKKEDYTPESNKTLNDKYPENKGIFFYIGTRAQNKWIYLYNNLVSGSTCFECEESEEDFDLVEEDINLKEQTWKTDNGLDLDSANDSYIMSDNKFLIFDRTPSGITINNYEGNEEVMILYKNRKFKGNLFEYLNRTPTGYTANDIDELISGDTESYSMDDFYKDIYENALAFKINDDGSIGYKYLVKDCFGDPEGFFSILEGNSLPNIINVSEWLKINVKIKASEKNMKLYFYVNGKLKYITKELPKLNLHSLNELEEKQEGVAYNISLGGGTQGLVETVLPDYMSDPTEEFTIEKYFAGSFIGDLKSFKFYTC